MCLRYRKSGQPEALADLVDVLGGSWTVVLSELPDPRGIRVGFLTMLAPVTTTQAVWSPELLGPIQDGDAATDTSDALDRRAAEAATAGAHVNAVLDGHGRERPLIVLGDLNDTPQAAATQMLHGPPGSQFDTGGFDHPDTGDAWRLWNLAPRIPEDHRYSRIFEGQHELIDHMLISHALLTHALLTHALLSRARHGRRGRGPSSS